MQAKKREGTRPPRVEEGHKRLRRRDTSPSETARGSSSSDDVNGSVASDDGSTSAGAAPPLTFRGRIPCPDEGGYTPRSLLELGIREGIGAILNRPTWWVKWRLDEGGAIRDKWLNEIENGVITHTARWSTCNWLEDLHGLDDVVLARWWRTYGYEQLDESGDSSQCAKTEYVETPEAFQQGNERMESYGQIVWYFELVLLNKKSREMPIEVWPQFEFTPESVLELGTGEAVAKAIAFLLAVRGGTVTKHTFATVCPEGDHRPEILDALWVHVDRIMEELDEIRQCITKTLEKVIENNQLDADVVTEFISSGPVQETWMSDLLINEELKEKFTKEVAVLENIPEQEKDWHPESNNQVLDLVHPSLYCCVFGVTKKISTPEHIADDAGADVAERMQRMAFGGTDLVENDYRCDAEYQWIPTQFNVDAHGDVNILSYINNLHPAKHSGMYNSIASIFKQFVPLFDNVLSCLLISDGPQPSMEIPSLCDRNKNHIPMHPRIPERLPLQPPRRPFSLRGTRSVQVIVQITEIHLTPDKPEYCGYPCWQVEGSDAEQIVATGLYCFGSENITTAPKLSFRVNVETPEFQLGDPVGTSAMYGINRGERLVQNLGGISVVENRCLVCSNTLQHRVEPVELLDRTRPGVWKLLAFFIVDPAKTIPSTATIPPQQDGWLRHALKTTMASVRQSSIPDVVLENVVELLGTGMPLEEAKQHRVKLMEERKRKKRDDDCERSHLFTPCDRYAIQWDGQLMPDYHDP